MLRLHFTRTALKNGYGDYDVEILMNLDVIWRGKLRRHRRGSWRRLVRQFSDQECAPRRPGTIFRMEQRLAAAQQELRALRALYRAVGRIDGHRGWLACVPAHDCRCEKARGLEDAKGVSHCTCGADEFRAALAKLDRRARS